MSSEDKDSTGQNSGRAVPKIVQMAKQAREVSAAHRAKINAELANYEGVESSIVIESEAPSRQRPTRPTTATNANDPAPVAPADSKNTLMIGGSIAIAAIIGAFLMSGSAQPPPPAEPSAVAETAPAQSEHAKRVSDIGSEAARLAAMAAERARAAEEEAKRMRERNALAEQALAQARADERARLAAELEAAKKIEAARLAAEQEKARKADAERKAAETEAAHKAEQARLAAAEEARKAEAAETARKAEQERAALQDKQHALDAAEAARLAEAEARAKFLSVKQPANEPATATAQTGTANTAKSGDANFSTDPCQGPSAKFLSTCR